MIVAVLIALLLLPSAVYAAADDLLIPFSTRGPDCYADGTPACTGEVYALVWSGAGVGFAGLRDDLTPVSTNDRVVLLAPVCARDADTGNMRCPDILFQVSAGTAESLRGGTYGVVLCDTRGAGGEPTARTVNSTRLLASGFCAEFVRGVTISSGVGRLMPVAGSTYVEAMLDAPSIIAFRMDPGGFVRLCCTNLSSVCRWRVMRASGAATPFRPDTTAVRLEDSVFKAASGGAGCVLFKVAGDRNYPAR